MNEDVFNASIRKFLKKLGVTAQREIEKTVRQALAEHALQNYERDWACLGAAHARPLSAKHLNPF